MSPTVIKKNKPFIVKTGFFFFLFFDFSLQRKRLSSLNQSKERVAEAEAASCG